jgi:hypothetical protein
MATTRSEWIRRPDLDREGFHDVHEIRPVDEGLNPTIYCYPGPEKELDINEGN